MFEGERRDTAMNHLFFPSWHLLCGQGQQDIKAFSCWNTKTCIDLLLSFKVTWDHFASLSVTQPSKHRPGEACPTCLPLPAHTGYSSALLLSDWSFTHIPIVSDVLFLQPFGASAFCFCTPSPSGVRVQPVPCISLPGSGPQVHGVFPRWCLLGGVLCSRKLGHE